MRHRNESLAAHHHAAVHAEPCMFCDRCNYRPCPCGARPRTEQRAAAAGGGCRPKRHAARSRSTRWPLLTVCREVPRRGVHAGETPIVLDELVLRLRAARACTAATLHGLHVSLGLDGHGRCHVRAVHAGPVVLPAARPGNRRHRRRGEGSLLRVWRRRTVRCDGGGAARPTGTNAQYNKRGTSPDVHRTARRNGCD